VTETSTTKAELHFSVWWGNQRDLARLMALAKVLQASASADARQRLSQSQEAANVADEERLLSLAGAIASAITASGGDPGRFGEPPGLLDEVNMLRAMQANPDHFAASEVKALELKMSVSHKSWNEVRTGSPDDLLEELDEREIVRIEIEFGRQYSSGSYLRIALGKDGSRAELGGNVGWVSSAAGQLEVELKKQSSRLGILFNVWAQVVVGTSSALLLSYLLFGNLADKSILTVIMPVTGIVCTTVATLAIQRFVPQFELVREAKPRVRIWVGAVMGLLGAVGVGLITNVISKVVGL
jgi:hypothetical protein